MTLSVTAFLLKRPKAPANRLITGPSPSMAPEAAGVAAANVMAAEIELLSRFSPQCLYIPRGRRF